MKARRLALWCLPLSVIVILAVIAGIALSGPSRAATLSGSSPAPAIATPSPSPSPTTTTTESASESALASPDPGVAAADQAGSAGAELAARKASLTAALSAMATTAGAPDFAVAVLDHTTGVSYTFGADETFETASVVKVEILAALLLQARQNGRALTASEQSLANVMIRQSDNDAATALWWKIGDSAGLSGANSTLGLTETVPGTDGWWGLTTTTVSDQIRLLDTIADPAGPLGDANQVILDLMGSVVADQDWGVSAAATTGESTVLKNGWMTRESQGGRWTVNSVGRITGTGTDLTIAVMTRGHATLADGISFVETIAKLTRTTLA